MKTYLGDGKFGAKRLQFQVHTRRRIPRPEIESEPVGPLAGKYTVAHKRVCGSNSQSCFVFIYLGGDWNKTNFGIAAGTAGSLVASEAFFCRFLRTLSHSMMMTERAATKERVCVCGVVLSRVRAYKSSSLCSILPTASAQRRWSQLYDEPAWDLRAQDLFSCGELTSRSPRTT